MSVMFNKGHTMCDTCNTQLMKLVKTEYGYVPVCKKDERFVCVPMVNKIKKGEVK